MTTLTAPTRAIPRTWDQRWPAVAVSAGLVAAAFTLWLAARFPGTPRDFDQTWAAARALLSGGSPYLAIGPGRAFPWPWGYYYPLTAPVSVLPLAALGQVMARAVFVGGSVGLLVWAFRERRGVLGPMLLSAPFINALWNAQWSPLVTAAMLIPALGWLGAAKPTLGLALIAQSRTRRHAVLAVVGGLALAVCATVLWPGWIGAWLASVRSGPHFPPPAWRWGGVVLLLAAFRWRRPEARLLLALALTPQTAMWYEALPLFLIPRGWREATVLALTSQLAYLSTAWLPIPADWAGMTTAVGRLLLVGCYLPALVLVLRRPD